MICHFLKIDNYFRKTSLEKLTKSEDVQGLQAISIIDIETVSTFFVEISPFNYIKSLDKLLKVNQSILVYVKEGKNFLHKRMIFNI